MRRFARGRASLFFAGWAERKPTAFLSADSESVPSDELATLRETYLEAGPDFEFASMVPRPMDLGVVSSVADETWRTFSKWPLLRGVTVCALFMCLFGTAFYLVRF